MWRVSSQGNVGIGTTGPGATLDGQPMLWVQRGSRAVSFQHFYNAPTETAPRWIIDRDLLGAVYPRLAFKQSGAGTVAADGGAIGQPAADALALYTSNNTALTRG